MIQPNHTHLFGHKADFSQSPVGSGLVNTKKKKQDLKDLLQVLQYFCNTLNWKKKKKWVLGKLSDTRNEALRVQVEVGGSID